MSRDVIYQVEIDSFAGPFDLLLKAIDEGEIDIFNVSISRITAKYFEYWRANDPPLVIASDFLFMAAYLLELKSRSVIPKREDLIDEEMLAGVEDSLVSHIQEYEVFKNLSRTLGERKEIYSRMYGRHEGESQEHVFELKNISLRDLVLAFQRVYREAEKREEVFSIEQEEISLEDRIAEIKEMLSEQPGGILFEKIFIRRTRLEIVVTFLAILELAKQSFICIAQETKFGNIVILPKQTQVKGEVIIAEN